jgi:hypothetical protein
MPCSRPRGQPETASRFGMDNRLPDLDAHLAILTVRIAENLLPKPPQLFHCHRVTLLPFRLASSTAWCLTISSE